VTGPEHFREAERLIGLVDEGAADWEPLAASALVHAALAEVAVAALRRRDDGGEAMGIADAMAWREAASMHAPAPHGDTP
jgi:hypothetical protein